jgi:polysaccharide export outer membrane protein
VSILVKEYNSKRISVFGQGGRPSFQERMDIVHAITLAGGFSPLADEDSTTVTRRHGGREKRYRVPVESIGRGRAGNFMLRPGDTVFVPEDPL